ncbi:MAG: hypothetical protein GX539_05925 [Candidatus Cloacimonetes bacterium]|jgi:hypothetical protein|nr:hypothetical protein [Candidatus Cloacimonadota bacterium]
MMDSPPVPVFLAGPFPVIHSVTINREERDVDLDVALLIAGQPNILASTRFPLDDTWERIVTALESGDARLGVAGVPHEVDTITDGVRVYPSAYIGLECANGERLVLSHIRGLDADVDAESYAREVIDSLLQGMGPDELGECVDD